MLYLLQSKLAIPDIVHRRLIATYACRSVYWVTPPISAFFFCAALPSNNPNRVPISICLHRGPWGQTPVYLVTLRVNGGRRWYYGARSRNCLRPVQRRAF